MTLLESPSAKANPPSTKGPLEVKSEKSPPQPSGRAQLKVGWEKFSDIASELRYLVLRQQAEVGENFEPFDPNWDAYFAREREGDLAAWTARTLDFEGGDPHKPESWAHKTQPPARGVLVGYILWATFRGLHSGSTRFANADLVYLAPEWREGMTGYKLLKTGIAAIRPLVDIVRVETNDLYEGGRMGVLLKRIGLRRLGSVYESEHR